MSAIKAFYEDCRAAYLSVADETTDIPQGAASKLSDLDGWLIRDAKAFAEALGLPWPPPDIDSAAGFVQEREKGTYGRLG